MVNTVIKIGIENLATLPSLVVINIFNSFSEHNVNGNLEISNVLIVKKENKNQFFFKFKNLDTNKTNSFLGSYNEDFSIININFGY